MSLEIDLDPPVDGGSLYEIRLEFYIMSYSGRVTPGKSYKHGSMSFLFLYIVGNMIKASTFHLTFICFVI